MAREGCDREGLDGRASGLAAWGDPRQRSRSERRRLVRRLSPPGGAHGRDHEALPRCRRERRRDLRGRRGRGARAPRRERRGQDDALEHPHRPLPPGRRGRSSSTASTVRFHSPRDALDAGICMVHQHFRLVEPFSVAENVVLGDHRRDGRRLVVLRAAIERRVEELSSRYGLAVNPKARIWQLSVGEQQRVEILKALYREARILIMDEPTAVLTPQEAEALFDDAARDGRRGKDRHLHLAQAPRGEGRRRPRDRAARRQDRRDRRCGACHAQLARRAHGRSGDRRRATARAAEDAVRRPDARGRRVDRRRRSGRDRGERRLVRDPRGRDRRRRRRRGQRPARARRGALGDARPPGGERPCRRPAAARRRSARGDPGRRRARARGSARNGPRSEPERHEQRRHQDVPKPVPVTRSTPRASTHARGRRSGSSGATT